MAVIARGWLALLWLLATEARAAAQDARSSANESVVAPQSDSSREGEAEDRRQRALRFYDAGNYSAAREEFERANQLMPSFRLLYNLGIVSMALGDSAAAHDFFQRYLSEGGSAVSEDLREQVRGQLHDLSEHIATLEIRVDPTSARVYVDDTRIPSSRLEALHVNAGFHRIWAQLEGTKSDQQRTIEVHGGETVRVDLKFSSLQKRSRPSHQSIFWVGWGSTALLAAGATVAGLEALSTHNTYQREFETVGPSRAELDHLDRRATALSITADALGIAALAMGTYSLYVTLRNPSVARTGPAGNQLTLHVNPNEARLVVGF